VILVFKKSAVILAIFTLIRLDALAKALSVIATATWLGGWLGVCHSRYCIKTSYPKTFWTIW